MKKEKKLIYKAFLHSPKGDQKYKIVFRNKILVARKCLYQKNFFWNTLWKFDAKITCT